MQRKIIALIVFAALGVPGCGSDSDASDSKASASESSSSVPASPSKPADTSADDPVDSGSESVTEPLRILVTADDGVSSPAIDEMARQLQALPDVEVTVVATKENQSGKSDGTTTPPPPGEAATTASGIAATAVAGLPADAVNHALDEMGLKPHVVVSGTNNGANIGPLVALSGTVGAARQAVRRGYPAVAASQGLGEPAAFSVSVALAVEWVVEHRSELLAGTADASTVTSFNAPTCEGPTTRGVVEVPVAEDLAGRDPYKVDCNSTLEDPADDVDAFTNGYATQSTFGPEEIPEISSE